MMIAQQQRLRLVLVAAAVVAVLLAPAAQAQCGDGSGSGCTCSQCNADGYSYFCPSNTECYSTSVTCDVGCSGSCQSTSSCSQPLTCSAAQAASCDDGSTCCLDQDGSPFCASGANQTCCNYGQLTCSPGLVCDPAGGGCVENSGTVTSACQACENMVSNLESKGCSAVCGFLPPPFDAVCTYAMSNTDLCQTITTYVEGGFTPFTICSMIPFISLCASNTTCSCGYCQPAVYGQWCLSLPNSCPASSSSADAVDFRKLALPAKAKIGARDICVDGSCSEATAGCCLTCAP